MKQIILISAALFLHALCFAADFRVISDTKVYDGDYHYIGELKKGDIVQLFDCSATTDEELDFAFTLLLNMNGKMRLVDLSTVIPNETSELFDERVRYTTLTAQGKNWIPVQNIDILRSRSRDRYYETYKNKLARYDEPDIFQISWHEHYTVRTAAQIENCFLYFTDEKNYAIFLYVKDIKTTGNGYMVSCEMFKSHTSDLFAEKNDFLENLTEKGQIVNLRLIFDGDYLHIYTEKNQRLFTYALMDSEYSAQMENLIRNETCDLSKVTWPRHADGTCDYEEANGNKEELTKRLIEATENNNAAEVRRLIAAGADVNAKNYDGLTALMRAAWSNSADVAEILLAAGADMNAKVSYSLTALMYAAANNAADVAKLLIDAGADIEAKDNDGRTAFMYAAENDSEDVAKLLIKSGADAPATVAEFVELVKELKSAPAVGKTATVTENLRLRTDDDRTAEVIATLAAGTRVKVEAPGRYCAIDGIASNWVRVSVLGGAQDKDGNAVAAGTEGWLFGGYLSAAEDAESQSPRGEAAAAKAPALPIALVAAGGAVLAVLLVAILLAVRKRKGGE